MRPLLPLAALIIVTTAAPAALARISANESALPAAQVSTLDARWQQAGLGHIDVLFVASAAQDAAGLAKREFQARHLSDDQAMMVVAIADHLVGVHTGQAFTDAGVTAAVIDATVQRVFVPLARQGDYPGAALALASALETARKDPTPALTRRATALQDAVQARLKQEALGHVRVDVEATRPVTPELAAWHFADHLLLPYEALVLENVADQRVWPVLGKDYRADQAAIQQAVDEAYTPLAKQGDVEGALVALARRLASFRPGPVPTVTPWRAAVDHAPAIRARLKAEGLTNYALAFEPGPVGTRKHRTYQSEDTTIVVYPKSRAIVAELGPIYDELAPLPKDVVAYGTLAMQGDVEGEILALARKLEQARQPIVAKRRKVQLLVGLGVALACGALGVGISKAIARQRRRSQRRLQKLEGRHAALRSLLSQVERASRRNKAALEEVDAQAQALLAGAQELDPGGRTDPDWLDQLEARTPMLEMGAAAVLTAYKAAAASTDPAAVDQQVEAANQAALTWQELSAVSKALRPVMSDVGQLDKLDKLLKDARTDLTQVPVALEQALDRLAKARPIREELGERFTLTKTVAASPAGSNGLAGLAARRALAWEAAHTRYVVDVPSSGSQGSSSSGSWGSDASSSSSGASAEGSWSSSDDRGSTGGGSW